VGRSTIVLAFYPADWSGGCTKELCTMRDNFDFLTELGVTVLGISGDYVFSHHEWAKHHNFQFALLSDHRHHVAEAYGSFDSLRGFNRRTVYVIDRGGRIAYIDLGYNANSEESFDQLRNALKHVQ
jgi:peroxiredoxin